MSIDYYCINLRTRPDRRAHMEKEFKTLDIRPIWCTVDKHPEGGVLGCFESHVDIWKYALDRRAEWICVFEDDVHTDNPKLFHDTINQRDILFNGDQRSTQTPFDALYLNLIIIRQKEILPEGFLSGSFYCTGCYLIRRDNLQKVLDYVLPQRGIPIDIAMIGLNCIGKKVFDQLPFTSDVNHNIPPFHLRTASRCEWLMQIWPIGRIMEQGLIICRKTSFLKNVL